MQKQDLSKIDFGKLTLPEWCDFKLRVKLDMGRATILSDGRHGDPRVAFLAVDGWAVSPGVDGHLLTELDQLRAICCQVDQFIATELAKLNAPNWVEVKWTEVERLRKSGVDVWHRFTGVDGCAEWVSLTDLSMGQCGINKRCHQYRVDLKTLPDGVALYEPKWVGVSWTDADKLREAGATVEFQHDNGLWDISLDARFATNIPYRADRKTFPARWEERKPAPTPTQKLSIRSRLDELLTNRHGVRVATPSEMVCALVDVLDGERSKGAVI